MKPITKSLIVLAMIAFASTGYGQNCYLVHANSQQMGIKEFNIDVTEVARRERVSTLKIAVLKAPDSSKSNAVSARWLMCLYNTLAAKRGFQYWAQVYPAKPGENVVIGFPQSPTEDMGKTLGSEFSGTNVGTPVAVTDYIEMCSVFTP